MGPRRVDTNKRLASIEIVCLVITAGFLGFITSESEVVSAANVWYVGIGPGNVSATINGGISQASDGDTVYVYSGTYYENVFVDKTINLTGENRDTTIINASGNESAVYISADWVNITGFTTIGSGDEWGDAGIELYKVQYCMVINNNASDSKYGIFLNFSDNNTLADNIGIKNRNPQSVNGFYFTSSSYNILVNNTFSYWQNGIYFTNYSDFNTIIRNNFSYNRNGIQITHSNNNTIVNNTIFMGGSVGISISYCGYGYNTIIGNTILSTKYGFYVSYSSYGYNNFVGNNIVSSRYGIYIRKSSYNTFIGNNISSSLYHGVRIEDNGYNTIFHNIFADNNASGVQAIDYVGTNFWNHTYYWNAPNPSGGNYWSDWTTPDFFSGPNQDQFGSDGIVDFPYLLDGGSGAKDYYPLTTPPPDLELPDLEVKSSDIVFDPSSPVGNGTFVTINAMIHNIGTGEAKDVIVRFYNGNPSDPGSYQIGSDRFLPSIGGGSSMNVEVQWTAGPTGTHNIYVVVDPNNTVIEMNEDNNVAFKALEVIELDNIPPTLYIKAVGDNIILNWTPLSRVGISHYFLYRSTSQTGFDFSNVWVNTSQHDDNGTIPLRTTWNDTGAASDIAPQEYYYVIRTVTYSGDVSSTSRTVGKWTRTFESGISTFSLPLEPFMERDTEFYCQDMNASYIKWMNTTTHTWVRHDKGDSSNNTLLEVGEGYEIGFEGKSIQTKYTFTGMPAAMISYDDNILFPGFDPDSEAKNLTVSVEPDGNVTLTWQEPSSMGVGDWYEVYYSNTRDGFFGTPGFHYDLACPPLGFGNNTTNITGFWANDPGARLYFMVVPFNASGVRGASTYSIGIWTEEFLAQYDTFGIPLKQSSNQIADWYCDSIPNTVGINYFNVSGQRWCWHSERMPQGAYDPILEMTEGYQISTSNETRITFIGR